MQGSSYAKAADSINVPILGKTSAKFKEEKGLRKSDSLRNELDIVELNMIALTESLAKRKIAKENPYENDPCVKVCFDIAIKVAALGEM